MKRERSDYEQGIGLENKNQGVMSLHLIAPAVMVYLKEEDFVVENVVGSAFELSSESKEA